MITRQMKMNLFIQQKDEQSFSDTRPTGSKNTNFSDENKEFLKNINAWVKKAIERQNNDQPVFDSLDHALVTSQICVKKKHF